MKQRGFTLIELIVVMAIAGIAAVIAVPNLISYAQRNEGLAVARRFTQDISWARNEAMTTGQAVTITVGSDCTWSTQIGSAAQPNQSLSAALKASSYSGASCQSAAATLSFGSDGMVSGTTTLTLPNQTFQVLASGTVLGSLSS
jgi:type II secretion system protein H